MTDNIIIREIEDSDYDILAEFNSNFSDDGRTKSEWLERYKMWWDDNPAYIKGHPRGVVAFNNNTVIGTTNNFPTRMIWDNKEITVINGSTWRVNQDFRKISMDIWHKHREITKGFVLFNTTAIPSVVKLLRILKFTEYRVSDKWYYYFGCSTGIENSIKLKLISITQKICMKFLLSSQQSDIEITKKVKHIKQIDHLWNKYKQDYRFTNVRDSDYIKWLSKTKDIYFLYSGNELIGFFIMHYNKKKKIFMLVDYWPSLTSEQIKIFIDFLVKEYKNYNIVIPSFDKEFIKRSKKNLFIGRNKKSLGYVHFGKEASIDLKMSFLTMLQGDFCI